MQPQTVTQPQSAIDPSQFDEYSDWAQKEMANGRTADELHQHLQSQGINTGATQPSPPQDGSTGGNWFTRLMPTAGSILGGIAGGVVTDGLGGQVVGSAGGSALGRGLENLLEGKSAGDNVATAGIEGGAGALAGGVLGKVFGKGAEALGNRAGTLTENAAKATAAEGEAAALAESNATKLAADNATKNNFGSIGEKLQGEDHLALGSNQKLLKDYGYDSTDPYAMRQASTAGHDHAGGASLNSVYDEALRGAKPVDMSKFGNDTYKILQNSGTDDLSTSPLGKVLGRFNDRTEGLYGKGTSVTLPDNMSATDLRKLQQAVGKEMSHQATIINNAEMGGLTNDTAEAAHSTLSKLYQDLGSKVKTPEVDAAIAQRMATPEERQALIDRLGETHGKQVADTIDKAKSADDLLHPMKSYAQMGRASDIAIDDIENKTATTRSVTRSKADIAAGQPEAVTPVPTQGNSTMSKVADGVGMLGAATGHPAGLALPIAAHGAKAVAKIAQSPEMLNTLSRVAGLAEKYAPAAGAGVASLIPSLSADPVATSGTMGAMNPSMLPQSGMPTPQPESEQQKFIDMMRINSAITKDPSATSFMSGITPLLQKNAALGTTLNGLPQEFANAGGAQGMGGIMSHISGMIPGTAANTYEQQATAAAHQISQLTGMDPVAAHGLLMQLMSNGNVAGQQQNVLSQIQGQLVH